jgi:fatty acid desaturase
VGSLVTATHQTEEIMFEQNGQFVDIQFRSTREADVKGLEAWLWGGMDTQLVHHLFPTMPRYRHHDARPVIQKWAEERGYDFRISTSGEILGKNFNHLKELAHI